MSTHATTAIHLRHPREIFVGGEWLKPSSDRTFDVVDCASEDVFLTVAEANTTDMEKAVAAARDAFDNGPWPQLSPPERGEWLNKLADACEQLTPAINESWTRESGTIAKIASFGGLALTSTLRTYAGFGESFDWVSKRTTSRGGPGLLVHEPVGVVAAIIPWNAPAPLIAAKIAPALIAGCTMILKASPEAPTVAYLVAEACEAIGLPKGVINVIAAEREVSEALVRHPSVDKVSFTGSTAAGRKIASACGERIARVTLELGGKSPAIICDDYDIAEAAAAIAQIATTGTSQVCMMLTRLIVNRKRHDDFVDALVSTFGQVKVGDPFADDTQMGPLAFGRQRDRVEGYIAKGKAEGATLAVGGGRPSHLNRGYYIEPTVFANVDNHHVIAQEEIFGPVLSVIPVDSEEEAIAVANDTIYGLFGSVFTNDPEKAYRYGRRIRAGTIAQSMFTNDMGIGFGGFKQSGLGREGGVEGLNPYIEKKTMIFQQAPSVAL